MRKLLLATCCIWGAAAAQAQDMVSYTSSDSFDDVAFAVETAIVGEGLVVDHVSYVGDMLKRTREDVGSDKVLFTKANVYTFCSAAVSRRVMEADPMNIVHCPYGIFVAQLADKPDEVVVGYRQYPEGPMQEVQSLLDGIVKDALGE
ncbi:hypothetical protein AVO45_13500 [Ruegeria marisrubri]|uniref:DUF302 domain-containing protein n=2 Tax=Ruegeria marisrubri TaxID=1685379 RepID=A0A0X3TCW1_9RHOB|nr:hypothetical protein AVO45_13500 [Ruegeria marisrubri]